MTTASGIPATFNSETAVVPQGMKGKTVCGSLGAPAFSFSRSLLRSNREIRDLNESITVRFLSDELRGRWPHKAAPATLRLLSDPDKLWEHLAFVQMQREKELLKFYA